MSAPNEDPKSQLDDRLNLVREIEERIDNDANREKPLTFWQSTCIAVIGAAVFLTWSVWTGTWPIPPGKENSEKAATGTRPYSYFAVMGVSDVFAML